MMYQFALQVVVILVIVSSIIAYIGNRVGRYFGKKRLSLFNLRPRDTATMFTIISGVLIALITFGTVILLSRDARTAFFGLERLRGQIRQARSQMDAAKLELKNSQVQLEQIKKDLDANQAEIKGLIETKEKLKKEVEAATSHRVIYPAQEVMYSALFKGGQGKSRAEADLNDAIGKLELELKKYRTTPIKYDADDYRATVGYLANMDSDVVVKIVALKNLTAGGTPLVRFDVVLNELIYHRGDEIWRGTVSGKLNPQETEQRVKELVASAENLAVKKGLLTDFPDAMGSYPYAKMYDAVRRIRGYGTLTRVSVLAASDIYSVGPFDVEFKVQP